VLGVRGMNASDRGDYPAAFEYLGESIERARSGADPRQQAWSLSMLARAHLLRSEHSQGAAALTRSLDLIREQRWMAFLPWPQTLRAELDLYDGDIEGAAERLEQAWVLACQLNDPCWEGMAARGLGLLNVGRGDRAAAITWFDEAEQRSNRVTDRYQWVRGYVLDAMVGNALDSGDPDRATPLVDALASLSARCDLGELVVRAQSCTGPGSVFRTRWRRPACSVAGSTTQRSPRCSPLPRASAFRPGTPAAVRPDTSVGRRRPGGCPDRVIS
jgi:hypothetical protein